MAVSNVQPMSVGEILDRSFQTMRHSLGTLFITALLGTLPYLLLVGSALAPMGDVESADPAGVFVLLFVAMALVVVATAVVWGALAYQIEETLAGRHVTVGGGLRNGLRTMLRVMGAGLTAYLLFLVLLVPPAFIGGAIMAVTVGVLGSGAAATIISGVGFVVPFALVLVAWLALSMLVLPVVVSEGAGPIRGIRRANQLAKGGRIRVCATAAVAWLLILLPTMGIPFLFGVGLEFWAPDPAGTVNTTQLLLANAGTILVGAVTTPFLVAVMVHTYYDRRARREGYDVELAAPAVMTEA